MSCLERVANISGEVTASVVSRRHFLRSATAAAFAAAAAVAGCKPPVGPGAPQPTAKALAVAPLTKAAEIYAAIPNEFKDGSGQLVATTKRQIQIADAKRTLVVLRQIHPEILGPDPVTQNTNQPDFALVHPCQNSIDTVLKELKRNPSIAASKLYAEGATETALKANVEQAYKMAADLKVPEFGRDEYLRGFVESQTDPDTRNWLKTHMANSAAHRQFYSGQMQPMLTEPSDYPATKKYLVTNSVFSRVELDSLKDIFQIFADPTLPADSPLRTNFVTNIGYFLVYKQALEEKLITLDFATKALLLKSVNEILDRVQKLDDKVPLRVKAYALAAHHILAGGYKPTTGHPIKHLANIYKEIFKEQKSFALEQMVKGPEGLTLMISGAVHNWKGLVEDWNRANPINKFNLIEISPRELAQHSLAANGFDYESSVEKMMQGYAQLKTQFSSVVQSMTEALTKAPPTLPNVPKPPF